MIKNKDNMKKLFITLTLILAFISNNACSQKADKAKIEIESKMPAETTQASPERLLEIKQLMVDKIKQGMVSDQIIITKITRDDQYRISVIYHYYTLYTNGKLNRQFEGFFDKSKDSSNRATYSIDEIKN
jgi:hypothetical protein